jgi:hypothetical protein
VAVAHIQHPVLDDRPSNFVRAPPTGHPAASQAASDLWLGLCMYSWIAPGIFRKMLEDELRQVRLRDDF